MVKLNEVAPAAKAARSGSDDSHYYGHTPERGWFPLYTPDKNYSLREARKDKAEGRVAVPSTTAYLGELRNMQVEEWAQKQAIKSAFRLMQESAYSSEDELVEHAMGRASGASRPAADLGTKIHAAIELAVAGKDYDAEMDKYVQPVLKEREGFGLESVAQEKCVGNLKLGYAGKADDLCLNRIATDYKSRGVPKVYPKDWCQVASYGYAEWGNDFFDHGAGIVFPIATKGDVVVKPAMKLGKDLLPYFEAFIGLTGTWRVFHNFDPRVST